MDWSLEHGMVVRRTGQGRNDSCIVWLHGLGESSVSFEPVVAALPDHAHVLVDLPGYGRSPWPDVHGPAPSLSEVAVLVSRWLANQPPAVLVGHSMGGVIATFIAELAPTRGVINVDGNLTLDDCTFSAQAAAYSLDEFVATGFDHVRADVYARGATQPELRGYHAAMVFAAPHVFHRHALDLLELSSGGSLALRLAALTVPKLFIGGVPDGICAASRARLDELSIPWLGLEPAGHWVYLDQRAAFASAVAAFSA